MKEREYSELARKALSDSRTWDAMTATPEGVEEMADWLGETRKRVESDLARRNDEWVAYSATAGQGTREYAQRLAEYRTWRSGATGFMGRLQTRSLHIKKLRTKTRLHRLGEESAATREALLALARAIGRHEAGAITDCDLHSHLDSVTVPHGIDGDISIRSVLTRLAKEFA